MREGLKVCPNFAKFEVLSILRSGNHCQLKVLDQPCKDFKNEKFFGSYMFGQRQLTITDVDLCKLIGVKDADHFIDRYWVTNCPNKNY